MSTLVELQKDLQNLREYLETDSPDLGVTQHRFGILRDKLHNTILPKCGSEQRGDLIAAVLFDQYRCEYLMLLHSGQVKEDYDTFLQAKLAELRSVLGISNGNTADVEDHEFE